MDNRQQSGGGRRRSGMKNRIGLIGLGHLGQFLVTGWAKADPTLLFFLANRSKGRAQAFAVQNRSFFSIHNQEIVDRSDIVILFNLYV